MIRLLETASSALAASGLLALALGCTLFGKPSWADEPFGGVANCPSCVNSTCGRPCDGDCVNSMGGAVAAIAT